MGYRWFCTLTVKQKCTRSKTTLLAAAASGLLVHTDTEDCKLKRYFWKCFKKALLGGLRIICFICNFACKKKTQQGSIYFSSNCSKFGMPRFAVITTISQILKILTNIINFKKLFIRRDYKSDFFLTNGYYSPSYDKLFMPSLVVIKTRCFA